MLYFYLLEQATFLDSIRPALSTSWRQRSFAPCRELCQQLIPRIPDYLAGRSSADDSPFLLRVAEGAAFDRRLWHLLVGEVLMFSAVDVPRIDTSPDALCCLLASDRVREPTTEREKFDAIQQAHFGSRDLVFGGGYYRPDFAGWNDVDDVARLHDYLAGHDTSQWKIADLKPSLAEANDEELAAELEYARQCHVALCEMYARARNNREVIVAEILGE